MLSEGAADQPTIEQLAQIVPGETTLDELYLLAGYPVRRKDFPTGVALMYPSIWLKTPHVILVDGVDGTVLMVAIENVSRPLFSLPSLKATYGESTVIDLPRNHLFFQNKGVATISNEANGLLYVVMLPKEFTLNDYEERQGFAQEIFAFTP